MRKICIGLSSVCLFALAHVHAYEINNHADMTQEAARLSSLTQDNIGNGKLFRLGLKQRTISDIVQTFPLSSTLPQIRECFGQRTNGTQDPSRPQPNWGGAPDGSTQLQIAQLFRYGACFEDNTEPSLRPLAHFYDPQHGGRGLTVGINAGPSSPEWILNRNAGPTSKSGTNHYTWADARDSFYNALTFVSAGSNEPVNDFMRKSAWGATFQVLGQSSGSDV